jgi:tRNA pseudouridine55 synthase
MSDDLILVDKPEGISSFDVIRWLRKELGIKKMGHAGTLDPMATGLLIIGVGPGTKKLHELTGLPKVYEAEILLGMKTDTADVTGTVVETKPVENISATHVRKVLESLIGELLLQVPLYSAIKQKGKPLYQYAREGKSVTVPKSLMVVTEAKFLNFENGVIRVSFNVGSGTYIRSLAEEIGLRLGTVATLKSLRRTSIGQFKVEEARSI